MWAPLLLSIQLAAVSASGVGAGRALVVGGPSEGAGGSMQESPGVGARWQDSQGLVWLKIPNAAMGVERAVAGADRARELTADEFSGGLAFENRPVEPDLPYAPRIVDVTGENRGWLALVEALLFARDAPRVAAAASAAGSPAPNARDSGDRG